MTDGRRGSAYEPASVDLGWQPEPLWEDWPRGRDTAFIMGRMEEAFRDVAIAGGSGKLLDVACGSALHAPEMHDAGWEVYGLEPSPEMIARAGERAAAAAIPLAMVRGIGEGLPFRGEAFDRVVCMSSIDHLANPDVGMREMARVLTRDGDLIVAFVNYGGFSCRLSRAIYVALRGLRVVRKDKRMFWDDPTETEHTFEGSIAALKRFAGDELVLDSALGVSMLWAVPGWSWMFKLVPGYSRPAVWMRERILRSMDRLGRAFPAQSDFVVLTWRRRDAAKASRR